MSDAKLSVGQAIDEIVKALALFDAHEQNTILSAACGLLKISLPSAATSQQSKYEANNVLKRPEDRAGAASLGIEPGIDIKSLRIQKQPKSAREMACVVGYYLAELAPEAERKKSITAADIEKYFKQAGYKLPKALEQVLPDAKQGGYFDSEARGEYKLNRVGHNEVVHNLPKGEKN